MRAIRSVRIILGDSWPSIGAHLVDVWQIEHGGLHDFVDQMRSDFGHFSSS